MEQEMVTFDGFDETDEELDDEFDDLPELMEKTLQLFEEVKKRRAEGKPNPHSTMGAFKGAVFDDTPPSTPDPDNPWSETAVRRYKRSFPDYVDDEPDDEFDDLPEIEAKAAQLIEEIRKNRAEGKPITHRTMGAFKGAVFHDAPPTEAAIVRYKRSLPDYVE